jgi:hypothetical protein
VVREKMNNLEKMMLTLLQQKPLSLQQSNFAKKLLASEAPFRRFIGQWAMKEKNKISKTKYDPKEDYAHEVLFWLSHNPSKVIRSAEIKSFVFNAAKSKRIPARINATQVLAKIAKRERRAFYLLKELKSDKSELVRHNARILLNELSPKYSSRLSTLASADA